MLYPDRIPDWFSNLFSGFLWHGDRQKKSVYLTFDDGPTPVVTDFVLDQLAEYDFKATFFLIGDCVQREQELFQKIRFAGHQVGNHTYNHLNSWKTSTTRYVENVEKASIVIDSRLFRPPYGRITPTAARRLRERNYKIILWDVLSGDFDQWGNPNGCLKALKKNTRSGSIVVFHDSEKAFDTLKKILPEYLEWLRNEGYSMSQF